jgi:hypothetical protein
MTKRRTGWRRIAAIMTVAGALALPTATTVVHGQATAVPTLTTAQRTATATRLSTNPASGEPIQDATMAALVLGALVVGGLTLRRYAERRA